jgi:hypothetical protein
MFLPYQQLSAPCFLAGMPTTYSALQAPGKYFHFFRKKIRLLNGLGTNDRLISPP